MSFTLTTSGAIIRRAGANASSTAITSGALLQDYCDQAESQICEAVDYDLVENYSDIATNLKPVISKAVASLAAIDVLGYDPTGYLNSENQLICDILFTDYEKIIASLTKRQKKFTKFGA